MTTRKCPKCKSRNFRIEDTCTTTYIYEVIDGKVFPEGEANDAADRVKTTCICSECGYKWHPRNFEFSIDE